MTQEYTVICPCKREHTVQYEHFPREDFGGFSIPQPECVAVEHGVRCKCGRIFTREVLEYKILLSVQMGRE